MREIGEGSHIVFEPPSVARIPVAVYTYDVEDCPVRPFPVTSTVRDEPRESLTSIIDEIPQ